MGRGEHGSVEGTIAALWDTRMALAGIAALTGVSPAKCCEIAKRYWASRPGQHKRPLVEELP